MGDHPLESLNLSYTVGHDYETTGWISHNRPQTCTMVKSYLRFKTVLNDEPSHYVG